MGEERPARAGRDKPAAPVDAVPRPVVAVTLGDPAGVGPEILAKALARSDLHALCRLLAVGDATRLAQGARAAGVSLAVRALGDPSEARFERGCADCVQAAPVPEDLAFGRPSAITGEAAFRFVVRAVELVREGVASALCTAPISKAALAAAGHRYPGHTELLAELTGAPEVSLALVTPRLRVIHVTCHEGLVDAIARIEPGLVLRTIARGRELVRRLGVPEPRIGVCGINPHAGEDGLFGRGEERERIAPAVAEARARGWRVEGPLAADALFYVAARGGYDLVVAMYHDQGHAPVKALGIEEGVNVTAGLPIVRTSVDHGTAFDIAGTGRASEDSLAAAIALAARLALGAEADQSAPSRPAW